MCGKNPDFESMRKVLRANIERESKIDESEGGFATVLSTQTFFRTTEHKQMVLYVYSTYIDLYM